MHVDGGDISPAEARALLGPGRIIGTFGGSDEFLPDIFEAPVDYLAIGPVFQTTTKLTDKAPIGFAGVRHLRKRAGPDRVLTAAAGITLQTAHAVLAAGATSVAVSKAIFGAENPADEFRKWLAELG